MLDIRWIRENAAALDAALEARRMAPCAEQLIDIDQRRRRHQTEFQELQNRRNEASKAIGKAKGKGEDAAALMAEVAELKGRIQAAEEAERAAGEALDELLAGIPNIPTAEVPRGPDESANVELRRIGAPRNFEHDPKDHVDLGVALGLMDFDAAARMSGARFVVLRRDLARLERAIANFMLDLHTGEHGYSETAPPYLVRDEAVYGVGQLPKFAEDMFRTTNGYWLISTSEIALTNLVREQILEEGELPLRFTAYTPCFRSEAGSAGRDTRGMIRQHQFPKVELVGITTPDQSEAEHERMTACAEEVLKRLDLPYRVMALSTGDMGFASRKTYDIEVWLPAQKAYREISSCSNCGDFQARRMKARFRPKEGKGTQFVHTLNGSALAVGRTLVAILENYQQPDGSIAVPQVLQPYMGGLTRLSS